jgi:hypothetical protein
LILRTLLRGYSFRKRPNFLPFFARRSFPRCP